MARQRNAIDIELVTEVTSISYNPAERIGVVCMPKTCCTDMGGAIELFRRIDSEVEIIVTLSEKEADTVYFKMGGGEGWGAVLDAQYSPAVARHYALEATTRVMKFLYRTSGATGLGAVARAAA